MKECVLISGGAGYIGSHTAVELIQAGYDRDYNVVAVQADGVEEEFSILLNEQMVNFSQPVTIVINDVQTQLDIVPDWRVLMQTTSLRGDPNYQFEAEIVIKP